MKESHLLKYVKYMSPIIFSSLPSLAVRDCLAVQIQKEMEEKFKFKRRGGGKQEGSKKANVPKLPAHSNYFQQNDSTVPEVD